MKDGIGTKGWLALGGLLLGSLAAQAGDTIKLGLPPSATAPTVTLGKVGLEADTLDAGYRGGYGGHYHGGYGGHYHGYYGGYRGYSAGYYRPYNYAYYPRFYSYNYAYRPYAYRPYFYSSYYYTTPSVYYYSAPICSPISLSAAPVMPPADSLNLRPNAEAIPLPREEGTFPYDGGPRAPVPMPRALPLGDAPPARLAPSTVPLDGRPVSLPAPTATPTKFAYPAYGELPRSTPFAADRVVTPVKK